MELRPRYGDDPVVVLDGDPAAIADPAARQRRRLVDALGTLDDEQWAAPSRCEGWSVRDVVVHLDGTNAFWTHSIRAGLDGAPTELLARFDPSATPAQMVAGAGEVSPAEVLDRFAASSGALADLLCSLGPDDWSATAESPPGHVSVSTVAHHALWDSWVHERDVLLPLGVAPAEEPDEVVACLRYAAALAPGLAVTMGEDRRGVLVIESRRPAAVVEVTVAGRVTVRAGHTAGATPDLTLSGDAVALVEALSIRRPLAPPVTGDAAWLVAGLATVFETDAPSGGPEPG